MQFSSIIASIALSALTVSAQGTTSICGSQIYTPGTATCYNGLLCLYKPNPATGVSDIITFPCGTVCYDRANYVCQGGALVVATGTASTASVVATSATTQTQGATGSATAIQSSAQLRSQTAAASSAARSAAATTTAAKNAGTVPTFDFALLMAGMATTGAILLGVVA